MCNHLKDTCCCLLYGQFNRPNFCHYSFWSTLVTCAADKWMFFQVICKNKLTVVWTKNSIRGLAALILVDSRLTMQNAFALANVFIFMSSLSKASFWRFDIKIKMSRLCRDTFCAVSDPERVRTSNQQNRNLPFYPVELRGLEVTNIALNAP